MNIVATTSYAEAQSRAVELRRLAQDAQVVAEERAAESSRLMENERRLINELEECQLVLAHLHETQRTTQATIDSVLGCAASEVRTLSKQRLEEVRSLTSPSLVLQRALSLLYCLLNPAKALQYKHITDISWKRTLAPMLKRDDLVYKLTHFNSSFDVHPLLAYPAVAELIASHICESEGADIGALEEVKTTPRKRTSANAPTNSIASRHAAQLLRARSAQYVGCSQTPNIGSSGGIVIHNTVDADTTLSRSSSSRLSVASALLADDGRLTIDAVEFASTAVGALFRWVVSQLRYARAMSNPINRSLDDQLATLRTEIEAQSTKESIAKEAAEVAHSVATEASIATEKAKKEAAEVAHSVATEASIATEKAKAEAELLREQATQAATEASNWKEQANSHCVRDVSPSGARLTQEEENSSQTTVVASTVRRGPTQHVEDKHETEPQLESVLENGDVAVSNVEVEIRERITFARGSAEMSSFATRSIQGVLNIMNTNPDLMICVEGHSQQNEPASISSKRANAVLEQLIKQGVPRHRLRQAGFGSAFPLEGGEKSSRVEFSVIQEISIKGTVQFSPCSAELTSASGPLLDKVVALLVARPCLRVRIEGHTDNSPNWGCSNQELSQLRSENVVRFLGDHGVDVDRLAPVGFGEHLPRIENASYNGKAKNRRVEFHVLQRETVQGLQDLVTGKARSREIDVHGLRQLERTATGIAIGLSRPIRIAAADLLVRLKADWSVQRLLFIAARSENPDACPLARLPEDCTLRILRLYFMLGCSSLNAV